MMQTAPVIAVFPVLAAFAVCPVAEASAQPGDARRAIVSIERIWDRAAHSAFTDLIRVGGEYYCAFREGSGHVPGHNGVIRVLASQDGENWRSLSRLDEEGVDLRDPKLARTSAGRVMVVMGGSVYEGAERVSMAPRVAFSGGGGRRFAPPRPVVVDAGIRTEHDWLWRVTWHGETAYGVVYQPDGAGSRVHLVVSDDGITYRHVTTFELEGRPSETTLRFESDGRMVALVRRDAGNRRAVIGAAPPPFTEWSWRELPERLGGPNLVRLPDGTWIAGGRHYREGGAKTALARVTIDGGFEWLLDLPSGGDTSYPGFVVDEERLLVSYYSSHEGKSAIYLATLRWKRLVTD